MKLSEHGVECFSTPQEFDFRKAGFGRSKAFYFRDPGGIILEIMQPLKDWPLIYKKKIGAENNYLQI